VTRAYVGLGANLGDPEQQLQRALALLDREPLVAVAAVSAVYRSAPLGPAGQPDYLNAAAAVDTDLPAIDLLDRLQAVEKALGRRRGERWGPRHIDLDLLLYGSETINTPRLCVPHSQLSQRNFVLQPLIDLCGSGFRLPGGTELGTLLEQCPGGSLERTGTILHSNGRDRAESGA
jgi:2-amino-4-hydroxy-6-hydroxymethyldihydropteridine diphosphokinase